jgi:hypothetical protein
MSIVKNIRLKVIPANVANPFIKKHHYSGKVVNNSSLHFGAFYKSFLHGVMSYGSPLDKRKVLGLVTNNSSKKWNEMLELNRMAFDKILPRNSESRCISISIKLLKKYAPHIKWLLSFADGTQCGDGAIYRASGFKLTQINKNKSLYQFPSGDIIAAITFEANLDLPIVKKQSIDMGIPHRYRTRTQWEKLGVKPLLGYQLRYIYIIDKSCTLNCPDIPYSKISEMGIGMYKGKKIERMGRNQTATSPVEPGRDNISLHTQINNKANLTKSQ